jgi:hypothetical protein
MYGQDYTKTSSPTACLELFQVLAHLGATLDWDIEQLDIKTTLLNGLLNPDEVCYMEQPEGFTEPGKETWVWRLERGLYGMKQGGHVWNWTMHAALLSWGFKWLECEHCVYFRQDQFSTILTAIHIDDFFNVGSTKQALAHFKTQL